MTSVSTISIALDAQTAQLKKGFAEGRAEVQKLSAGLSGNVAAGMAKFHLAVLAVKGAVDAVRGSIQGVLNTMAEIDVTEKFAARVGIASDQLRILNFAAEQSGASAETMNMALQRMTRRVSEAANGTGEAVAALAELNLSAEDLERLSPDKQFGAIADAMANVDGQADKVRLSMKLFDSEGVALVNTLAGGSAGLDEFGRQAESLGMLLGDQGAAIENANNAINRMKHAWDGLVQQVVVLLAPALESIANIIAQIVRGFNRLFGLSNAGGTASMKSFATSAVGAAKSLAPLAEETERITERVQTAAEKAQAIVDATKKELASGQLSAERGIGAVTRGTTAGFSAVQDAYRARRDQERRDAERNTLLRAIYERLNDAGLSLVEVTI